jgi:hypothetical protein
MAGEPSMVTVVLNNRSRKAKGKTLLLTMMPGWSGGGAAVIGCPPLFEDGIGPSGPTT